MADNDAIAPPAAPTLRETPVDQTKRLPTIRPVSFSPAKLFADHAFAARIWCLIALAAVGFCLVQPYLIIGAYRTRERVVVLDGAGTFSVSPLLGFEEANSLHEAMALWATLALLQRNPKDFDFPDLLKKIYLDEARRQAEADREKMREEFEVKQIHQKPEVFKIDLLHTRENTLLVKVEGQLLRTGVFEGQALTESLKFTLNLTLVRNPDMAANKRYPFGVWSYDCTIF